jgi:hypothetical protein
MLAAASDPGSEPVAAIDARLRIAAVADTRSHDCRSGSRCSCARAEAEEGVRGWNPRLGRMAVERRQPGKMAAERPSSGSPSSLDPPRLDPPR